MLHTQIKLPSKHNFRNSIYTKHKNNKSKQQKNLYNHILNATLGAAKFNAVRLTLSLLFFC